MGRLLKWSAQRTLLCFSLLAVMFASPAWGQDESPVPTPALTQPPAEVPTSTVPVADPAAVEDPPAAEAPAEAARPVDHLIYIPYDRLSDVIDRLKSKVVLSYEEYLELVKQAQGNQTPHKLDNPAILSTASYSAVVNGEVAEITAVLKCRALKDRWASLPISFADAAVGEVTTAEENKVLLRGTGEGTYEILFPKAGDYTITLKLLKRITQSPGGPSLELKVPPVGITTFELSIPKSNQKISISPRHIEIPPTQPAAENRSTIAVSLGATNSITAIWVPDMSDRPEMDLLTTVSNQLQIAIADGLIHTEAKLEYRVLRGELDRLRIAVPKGNRILDVTSSARLEGWTVEQEDRGQIINIKLLSAVDSSCTVEIHTERALPEDPIALAGIGEDQTVHGIHSLDVTREQGQIRLTHGEELTVVVEEQAGLVRTDLGEKGAAQLAYRYFSPTFSFIARFEPVQPILDLKHDNLVIFREQRIELTSQLEYTIRKAGVFQLQLKLPADFELLGVNCPQMSEFQHEKASNSLIVVLKERTQGTLSIQVRGYIPPPQQYMEADASSLANLPQIEPVGIRQEEGRMIAYTIEAIELAANEDQVKNAQPIPVNGIPYNFSDTQVRAAWKFQTRPVEIPVRIIRRPTRLSAQTYSTIQVQPSGIQVTAYLDFLVQYAGIDQFRIAVPKEFSDQIEIEIADKNSVPIQQKSPQASDEESQWVIWNIQTQRPVTGRQRFKMTYDISLNTGDTDEAEEEEKSAAELSESLLIPKPLGWERGAEDRIDLTRSTGEIVIQTDPALSVAVKGMGTGIEPIDVRELTMLPQQGHQAFRYPVQSDDDPIRLELQVSRFEVAEVVSTVVSKMLSEYVLGTSADMSVRSQLQIQSSQRQRLIVQLPESAQPMVVLLDGETRQLQKGEKSTEAGWTNYVVNVSRSKNSEESFTLTLQYLMKASPLSESTLRGAVEFSVPRVLNPGQNSAVVQESRCIVWMPRTFIPIRVNSPYERWQRYSHISFEYGVSDDTYSQNDQHQWAGNSMGAVNFPTEGLAYTFVSVGSGESLQLTYWNRHYVTALMTVLLLVLAFVLLKTSWENKVLVVLVVIAALAAGSQFAPEVVKQLVYSARYGIVFVAGIWIVHGLFQIRTCCFSKSEPLTQLDETPPESIHDDPAPGGDV